MIIPFFDPEAFRTNPFYRIHGIVLTQYDNDQLTDLFVENVILYGQNALNIIAKKFIYDQTYQEKTLSYIGSCLLAHVLYTVQYNLVAGSVSGSHKGAEGQSFFAVSQDKEWWSKTTHGGLVWEVMDNNPSIFGYNSPNIFDYIGG